MNYIVSGKEDDFEFLVACLLRHSIQVLSYLDKHQLGLWPNGKALVFGNARNPPKIAGSSPVSLASFFGVEMKTFF